LPNRRSAQANTQFSRRSRALDKSGLRAEQTIDHKAGTFSGASDTFSRRNHLQQRGGFIQTKSAEGNCSSWVQNSGWWDPHTKVEPIASP
jgi:hypothetical protein